METGDIKQMQDAIAGAVRENWKTFLIEGIVLMVLGVLAIALPVVATLAVEIFLGWLFLVSGVVGLVTTFMARGTPGFWWALISALIAIVAGVLLLGWPASGVVSLTILLVAFFLVEGVATIMYALEHKKELSGRWGWMLVSGLIDLVLAVMIFAKLPSTAAWAIGLLVGINMLFGGTALAAMALSARDAGGTPTAPKPS